MLRKKNQGDLFHSKEEFVLKAKKEYNSYIFFSLTFSPASHHKKEYNSFFFTFFGSTISRNKIFYEYFSFKISLVDFHFFHFQYLSYRNLIFESIYSNFHFHFFYDFNKCIKICPIQNIKKEFIIKFCMYS